MVQHCADANCAHSFVVYVYVANGGYMVGAINDSGQCCEAAYRQGTCVCVCVTAHCICICVLPYVKLELVRRRFNARFYYAYSV